jgi:hypothetical protein
MATHPERPSADLDVSYLRPATRHDPLTGRAGAPLGVEPMPRSTQPEPEDSGLSRRAIVLRRNEWSSVPPPAA